MESVDATARARQLSRTGGLFCALALSVATTAFPQPFDPEAALELVRQGRAQEEGGQLEQALSSYERAAILDPTDWRPPLLAGETSFKLGQVEHSLELFDRVVSLAPDREPYLWQRGISQYYAGQFEACARQFRLHRTVNPNDVENAAWHFLCQARSESLEAARKGLLPVGPDPRPGLSEIYRLFSGELEAEDLGSQDLKGDAFFYTELYLGLYFEAAGMPEQCRAHLERAAAASFPHYMGFVARVHLDLLEADEPEGR